MLRRSVVAAPALIAIIVVFGICPLTASASPCKSAGESCRTTQSCCTGVCAKGTGSFGTCCIPTTCAAQGASCGTIPDGCGGTLDCGGCTSPNVCGAGGTPNACGACPTAETDCSGACSNTSSDNGNCGTCGNVCTEGTDCQDGACIKKCSKDDDCTTAIISPSGEFCCSSDDQFRGLCPYVDHCTARLADSTEGCARKQQCENLCCCLEIFCVDSPPSEGFTFQCTTHEGCSVGYCGYD
jgi:hypothetical protein